MRVISCLAIIVKILNKIKNIAIKHRLMTIFYKNWQVISVKMIVETHHIEWQILPIIFWRNSNNHLRLSINRLI